MSNINARNIKIFNKLNKSILLGVTHNTKESVNLVNDICAKNTFDYFLLELNFSNYIFIKKNKLYFSEFYKLITNVNYNYEIINRSKTKLIDYNIETELKLYNSLTKQNLNNTTIYTNYTKNINTNSYSLHNNYLFHKLHSYYFSKLYSLVNFDKVSMNNLEKTAFYVIHYEKRENKFIEEINKYKDYKILVVVGNYHFDQIKNKI